MAYPLMRHVNARVCRNHPISYFNFLLSHNPYHDHELYQGVAPPGLSYLTYRRRAKQGRQKSTQAKQAFMQACVCSNHPISPLIIMQSSNLSLYTMFALLHGEFTITRDKQCACCRRSKQDLYVYALFFEFTLSFLNSFFLIAPRSKRGISGFIIYCVSRHFLILT